MVETVGAAWYFHFTDFADIGQQVQIPIYRPAAYMGVFPHDRIVDLVSGDMTPVAISAGVLYGTTLCGLNSL